MLQEIFILILCLFFKGANSELRRVLKKKKIQKE